MSVSGKVLFVMAALTLAAAMASLAGILMVYSSLPETSPLDMVTEAKRMAGELADNNLPEAAIEEYRKALDDGTLTSKQRGAIHYLIGNLFFEDIGDYEKAAAEYIRARALDEEASYATEAGKKLIASLEKMGRQLAARRELDRQANIDPDTTERAGKIVARVGGDNITVAEFDRFLESVPPAMREDLSDPDKKRQLLDQMIGRELIYHAALREGLDKDATVQKDMRELEKEVLIQFYTQEKIAPTVRPDSAELMLYFNANKDAYGDKPFDEVRDRVMQDYVGYIGQKAINEYIGTLTKVEPVQVFEENLK